MQPSEADARHAMELVREAFPNFSGWESGHPGDDLHWWFCVYGEKVFDEDTLSPRRFFVTLQLHEKGWRGYLTVGQHAYMWTSADFGDAYLVDTEYQATAGEAVAALKLEILGLFDGLVGPSPQSV